jgi:23S rRNA pseudouridine2605 synthase
MLERVQKIISAAGITSRRAAEELISEGRVRVNGKVVTELGTKADASKDHIKVDGKLINPRQPLTYIMLNKPEGFVTTMSDPEGRPTVQDLMKGVKVRVYPVGRLDYNTVGLLLMTNDGDFAHLITHPKHEFPKTYLAKVKGVVEDARIKELEQGVYLDDGRTAPAKIKKVRKEEANSWLEITIHEGRKRQVRRMFDRVGHSVIRLKRIKTGNLTLGDLPEGSYRYLASAEVQGLREASEKIDVRSQEPVVRSQKREIRNTDKKRAHRGRMPDARPGRAVWSEEKKGGAGANRTGSRGQGAGFRSSTTRPGVKPEWRSSSSRPATTGQRARGRSAEFRSASTRPGAKPEWRSSSSRPATTGQGARGRSSEFRSASIRPGAKPEWRSSGPRTNVGGSAPRNASSRPGRKPAGRRSIPKTMVKVERSKGPRKK